MKIIFRLTIAGNDTIQNEGINEGINGGINGGINEGINEGISLLLLTIQKYEGKRSGYLSKIIYIPQKTIAVVVYFKN